VGASDLAHRDLAEAKARGYRDLLAPATFPVVLTMAAGQQVIDDPELGLDFSRVVHGEQRFRYTRPVVAGDKLTCVCVVEEVTSRAGHDFLTTRTEVATVHGEPVVTVWSKLVVRGPDGHG
jgi:acyl dehydratase